MRFYKLVSIGLKKHNSYLKHTPRNLQCLSTYFYPHIPTLIFFSQLSSIPGLDDVTVEVSPVSVTGVTNETTSEPSQVSINFQET